MQVYVVLYEDGEFEGVYTKENAYEVYNSDTWLYQEPKPYELDISKEDLENASKEQVIGYCFGCDCSLTEENVVYDCDNKPFKCQDCRTDVC